MSTCYRLNSLHILYYFSYHKGIVIVMFPDVKWSFWAIEVCAPVHEGCHNKPPGSKVCATLNQYAAPQLTFIQSILCRVCYICHLGEKGIFHTLSEIQSSYQTFFKEVLLSKRIQTHHWLMSTYKNFRSFCFSELIYI